MFNPIFGPNFLDFILVELLNLVTEKFNPIFGLNFRGEGGLKKFRQNTYFHFFLWMTSLSLNILDFLGVKFIYDTPRTIIPA